MSPANCDVRAVDVALATVVSEDKVRVFVGEIRSGFGVPGVCQVAIAAAIAEKVEVVGVTAGGTSVVRRGLQIGSPGRVPIGSDAEDVGLSGVNGVVHAGPILKCQAEGDIFTAAGAIPERLVVQEE